MLKITVIEDIKEDADELKSVLQEWEEKAAQELYVSYYKSGEDYFASSHLQNEDVFLIDIKLSGMSGIEFAKKIYAERRKSHIIFLTAYAEYALEGYPIHAFHYLLKPVTYDMINVPLSELVDEKFAHLYHFQKSDGSVVQLNFDDIYYIISERHSVVIHTDSDTYTQNISISDIIGHLPRTFVRVHRSYIVNMVNITNMKRSEITLSDSAVTTIPIGRSHIPEVQMRFAEYASRFERH